MKTEDVRLIRKINDDVSQKIKCYVLFIDFPSFCGMSRNSQ